MEGDSLKTQLAIQRLEQGQEETKEVLTKVSDSLKSLVDMQKSHEIFHATVNGKFETQAAEKQAMDNRLKKVEGNQTWVSRFIISAVIMAVVAFIKGA